MAVTVALLATTDEEERVAMWRGGYAQDGGLITLQAERLRDMAARHDFGSLVCWARDDKSTPSVLVNYARGVLARWGLRARVFPFKLSDGRDYWMVEVWTDWGSEGGGYFEHFHEAVNAAFDLGASVGAVGVWTGTSAESCEICLTR